MRYQFDKMKQLQSLTQFSLRIHLKISGHYQCVPTNTEQAAVLVHVLDGR